MSGPFSIKELASILEMLQKHEVTEFKLERGDEKISLRRGEPQRVRRSGPRVQHVLSSLQGLPSNVVQFHPHEEHQQLAPRAQAEVAEAAPELAKRKVLREVTSPMVGTFYRRPAVDAEPFVETGDSVKKGDVLCIIEAMKLMNEIESDVAGRIVEVCLEDGQMVEYGEVLFRVEPI